MDFNEYQIAARRLADSMAVLGTTDVIILGSILLVTLVAVVWLISKT